MLCSAKFLINFGIFLKKLVVYQFVLHFVR